MFWITNTVLLFLALPSLSMADSLDAYLLKALHDTRHAVVGESEKNVHTGVSGWIDGAQLRLQAQDDQKNPVKSSYTLRVTPKFGTQRSAEQSMYELGTRQRMLNADRVVSQALKMRYRMLIDFAEQRAKTAYERQHIDLLKVEINLNRALAKTTEFNPENLQHLILELSHARATLRVAEKRLQAMRERIQADRESSHSHDNLLNTDWPLTPRHIDEVLTQHQTALTDTDIYPQTRQAHLALDLASARLDIVQAKTGLALDLIDIEYSNDQEDNAFGVQFGFNLPTGGGNSRLIDRRQDRAKSRTVFMLTRHSVATLLTERLESLNWSLSAWKTDDAAVQEIQTLRSEPVRTQHPKLVIGLKRQLVALDRTMSATHMQLLRDYIDVLDAAGILSQNPLRNWIKVGQPALQE